MPTVANFRLTEALERLVDLYTNWDMPDEAARWQEMLDEVKAAEAKLMRLKPPDTRYTAKPSTFHNTLPSILRQARLNADPAWPSWTQDKVDSFQPDGG